MQEEKIKKPTPTTTFYEESILAAQKAPFEHLWNNEELADIYFIVGTDDKQRQRIPAHRQLLAARSAVFKAMFYGGFPLKSDVIEIPDIEPAAFLILLKFCYANKVEINAEIVMATLNASKKYDVAELSKFCVDFLISNLAIDNAVLLLMQARFFDELELARVSLGLIGRYTTDALNTDEFMTLNLDTLICVLEYDRLQAFESTLFNAIVLWSEAECLRKQLPVTTANQRFVLGRAFNLIRFGLMTYKEFVNGPIQSGLLDANEIIEFSKEISAYDSSTPIPRCCKPSATSRLKFFHKMDNHFSINEIYFKDQFKVNRPVVVVGVAMHPETLLGKSGLELSVIDEEDEEICHHLNYSDNESGHRPSSSKDLTIMFNKPVLIRPGINHRIDILLQYKCPQIRLYHRRHTSCLLHPIHDYGFVNIPKSSSSSSSYVLKVKPPTIWSPNPAISFTNEYSGVISQLLYYVIE